MNFNFIKYFIKTYEFNAKTIYYVSQLNFTLAVIDKFCGLYSTARPTKFEDGQWASTSFLSCVPH